MGFGIGIFLLVVGAILKFAVSDRVSGVDLGAIGWICMGAGVLAILLGLFLNAPRRRVTRESVVNDNGVGAPTQQVREVRTDDTL